MAAPSPSRRPDAPNVLLVVLDDVGYAQLGCYGSDIATPAIDRLAAGGVRLANFHTTALCSPTRAVPADRAQPPPQRHGSGGRPGHGVPRLLGPDPPSRTASCPRSCGQQGYASYAVGKWHLTPDDETHMAASRRSWPLGRGFDRWYGFHGGETHQFVPALYHDNHAVAPPRTFEPRATT